MDVLLRRIRNGRNIHECLIRCVNISKNLLDSSNVMWFSIVVVSHKCVMCFKFCKLNISGIWASSLTYAKNDFFYRTLDTFKQQISRVYNLTVIRQGKKMSFYLILKQPTVGGDTQVPIRVSFSLLFTMREML